MYLILKSLAIILAISSLIGVIGHYMFNISFLGCFAISTIVQLLAGYFVNTWLENRSNITNADREADLIKEFNRQGTNIPCAYCGEINFIPIRTDLPNDFTCGQCGEENAVYISITSAQKTDTVQSSPLEVLSYNTQLETAKNQILERNEG